MSDDLDTLVNEFKARITAIIDQIATAKQELEEVRNDMMSSYDEQPETWQKSEPGEKMDVEIDVLTDVADTLDNTESDLTEVVAGTIHNKELSMSNGVSRRDLVVLMKEMIARFEGQPEIKGRA